MRTLRSHPRPAVRRAGTSMIELSLVLSLFTIVMLSSMAMIESGQRLSSSTMEITTVEDLATQMLFKFEKELANAAGERVTAELTAAITAADTTLPVDDTRAFPPTGWLVLGRGTPTEERVRYTSMGQNDFLSLQRGQQCSIAQGHAVTATCEWGGMAIPSELDNPPPEAFDGLAQGILGQVFFIGDGTGFVYRSPVDPAGGSDYVNGHELNWGSEVMGAGVVLGTGYSALYFEPVNVISEADVETDLNGDGDELDVFDVGQIRRVRWDSADPNATNDELGLGPTAILQEQCNWGGDLDGDGFDDPMFLWDDETRTLEMRLFVVGSSEDTPVVRRIESTVFLRNHRDEDIS